MKQLILLSIILIGCTNSPALDPEKTSAKANQDQARALEEISIQLKRIANTLETIDSTITVTR